MNKISIPMAIFDVIPVVLFLIANFKLMDSLYNKMTNKVYALFSGGALILFAGAICKLLWKFLYAFGLCDYTMLSECFFPMQSIGFIFMCIAFTKMLKDNKKSGTGATALNAVAIPIITTKMPFLLLTFVSMTYFYVMLGIIAVKIKCKKTIILMVLSYAGMLANCFVGSASDGSPIYHWIAEFAHLFAEIFLLWSVITLSNSGLKEEDCFVKKQIII